MNSDNADGVPPPLEVLTRGKPQAGQVASRIQYSQRQNIPARREGELKIAGYPIGLRRGCPVRGSICPVPIGVVLAPSADVRPFRGSPSVTWEPVANVCLIASGGSPPCVSMLSMVWQGDQSENAPPISVN